MSLRSQSTAQLLIILEEESVRVGGSHQQKNIAKTLEITLKMNVAPGQVVRAW